MKRNSENYIQFFDGLEHYPMPNRSLPNQQAVAQIEALILAHKDAVYRQMIRVCGNYEDAEDALADAILAALRSVQKIQNHEAFRAWLTKVGSRCCARLQVRRKLALSDLSELDVVSASASMVSELEHQQTKECILRAIDALPGHYRDVIVACELQGQKAREAADSLGISAANLKSRLHRARTMVRALLDNELAS